MHTTETGLTGKRFARELRKISLYDETEIAPGLFYAVDSAGMPRLHDGTWYRGYVQRWSTPKKGKTWLVRAWAGPIGVRREFTRGTYRSINGAVRALQREGIRLHSEA